MEKPGYVLVEIAQNGKPLTWEACPLVWVPAMVNVGAEWVPGRVLGDALYVCHELFGNEGGFIEETITYLINEGPFTEGAIESITTHDVTWRLITEEEMKAKMAEEI
jgi:hypothetical protein